MSILEKIMDRLETSEVQSHYNQYVMLSEGNGGGVPDERHEMNAKLLIALALDTKKDFSKSQNLASAVFANRGKLKGAKQENFMIRYIAHYYAHQKGEFKCATLAFSLSADSGLFNSRLGNEIYVARVLGQNMSRLDDGSDFKNTNTLEIVYDWTPKFNPDPLNFKVDRDFNLWAKDQGHTVTNENRLDLQINHATLKEMIGMSLFSRTKLKLT